VNALASSNVAAAGPAGFPLRPARATLLWLAAADARGHLMRAHLVRAALARRGVAVRIVTTSHQGRAFLAALGTPSELLSTGYAVAFDARQNLDRAATRGCILRYGLGRDHAARDRAALRALSRGADLLVNDFHPLPLVLPRTLGAPVVHVYGTHLWGAIAHHFAGRAPDVLDRATSALVQSLRDRAFACVEHTLAVPAIPREPRRVAPGGVAREPGGQGRTSPRHAVLPPIVAAPTRTPAEVRAALGVGPRQRLAAVYLNPHFRDAKLASDVEAALARRGFRVHAVGEGLASRPGWRTYDPKFNDVAAAADVLVSAPGMGALAAWAHFGTPLLALRTDQPEQIANVGYLAAARSAPYSVVPAAAATPATLDDALAALTRTVRGPRPDPSQAARAVQARWADAFCSFLSC
jgi:hypothetical protein